MSAVVNQDAMRVANRYAATVEKAETLQGRARACRDAAEQYRRDAQANQESAQSHEQAARTIRDPGVAQEHALAARDAEAEAAREILAARYYEEQAEQYEAQARAAGGTVGGTLASKEIVMGESTTSASTSITGPPDVLGYADGDTCHGTDQVASAAGPGTTLALMDYGDGGDRWDGGRYVAVGTSPGRWDPVTSTEHTGDGDAKPGLYAPPHLDPAEAEVAARHLDELADLAEAGHRPPKPTKWGRAAQRLEHLLAGDADLAAEKVMIGDDELPVSVRDLLAMLRDKQPTAGPSTRRHVATTAMDQSGGDTGVLWMDLVDHDGATRVAVTGVEGTEDPDDDYWQPYTSQLTAAQARELATKLRTFAGAALDQGAEVEPGALYLGTGEYLDWSTTIGHGGRQIEVGDGVDAVTLDLTAGQAQRLCEQLHHTLTQDPRAEQFVRLGDSDDDAYIDWSTPRPDGGCQLVAGTPGGATVAIDLTRTHLAALDEQLGTDLELPGQAHVTGNPGSSHQVTDDGGQAHHR
ncbi:hypothetical protein [Micromonospora tarensis]|uniref:Uncharacterized protein n=1 Tax=Micromonospora tarensis TaxID=2806100 RepID=A0ABS1YRE1_9ACTN|nr:hypothetical protein [Micromonospora tarensis]MBM0280008.1 hypothetical protein [Micromonospora tarensis]